MAESRKPKDQRYRDRCFPNAQQEVIKTKTGGFVPLPIISRRLMKYLSNAELRVWLYLQTRASKFFICYPLYEEIMRETGLSSKGTISKAVRSLEKWGFITTRNDGGTRRYLIRDPRLAAQRMTELGDMSVDELEELNDLLEQLGQPIIEPPKPRPSVVSRQTARPHAQQAGAP